MRDIWMVMAVGCGGAIGAIARFGIAQLVHRRVSDGFAWGTFWSNVIGCFLMGLVLALSERGWAISPHTRVAITTGFLGALTTFSTFGWETIAAAQLGHYSLAICNVAANLLVGLAAVWVGLTVGTGITITS